ncbi:ML2 [Symbiodinium pilosum]|uniref:ML2 protein n=1 Tax=Symbiodinium pilosum TaxID=2952 RepID=A0A812WU98_SYMPI|nr:ML2 [Symbiodinium pilosum]
MALMFVAGSAQIQASALAKLFTAGFAAERFSKLQSEEQKEPAPAKPKELKVKEQKKEPVKDSEEEEEDNEDPSKELKRMKELMGDEIEADDEQEEEEEEESHEEDASAKLQAKDKAAKLKASKAKKPGFDVEQGQSIFVRNVPFDAEENDLKEVFRRFGKVSSVKLVADKTGAGYIKPMLGYSLFCDRGSAFVKFAEAPFEEPEVYEYLRGQRKASEDDKVTPLPSPHARKDDLALGLQDCHTPSPPAHGGGGEIGFDNEDFLEAVTPPNLHRVSTYEHDLASTPEMPEQASEQWQGNAFFPCYPGPTWMPASAGDMQTMHCAPSMQYLPQQASPALVYYCVGYLAPESVEQHMLPADVGLAESYDSGYVGSSASQWSSAGDTRQSQAQSSQKRPPREKKEPQPQPKVLEAGEVRRDSEPQGSTEAVPAVKDEERTTIMLRNIPKDTTREALVELLDSLGYAKMYDFLYLPRDFKDNFAIYGYAFVNFISHEQASQARELFDGFVKWHSTESQIVPCEAHWGYPLQGYAAHVERYRNSPVMSSQVPEMCRPLVFKDGQPVSFPAPTKPIRLPRRKGWILAGRRPELREPSCQ